MHVSPLPAPPKQKKMQFDSFLLFINSTNIRALKNHYQNSTKCTDLHHLFKIFGKEGEEGGGEREGRGKDRVSIFQNRLERYSRYSLAASSLR